MPAKALEALFPPSSAARQIEEAIVMGPDYINPLQWHNAMGLARQSCARVFRDGGTPGDALKAFGLRPSVPNESAEVSWDTAVARVAQALCAKPMPRAA